MTMHATRLDSSSRTLPVGVEVEVEIPVSRETVFEFLADLENNTG
jgi:hypothetical protein